MATIDGNDGVIKIGSDVLAKVVSYSLTETAAVQRDDGMGEAWQGNKAGKKSWSARVEARFDDSDTAQEALTAGASGSAVFIPRGDTSGNKTKTGNFVVESVEENLNQDDRAMRSFSITGDGALSAGTVPA